MAYDDLDELLGGDPAPTMALNRPAEATEAQLASFWGVTARQVRMLVTEGAISKSESGLFDVQNCTRAYLRSMMAKANRKTTSPDLAAEKLRLTREQADAVELKNALARGELVTASDVKSTWASILTDLRAAMLAIPARLSLTDRDLVDSEIRVALERLSENG
ncbi:MAG: hypothetical protein ACTHLA_04885 [Asticcacaulis sp.]|uniref:hypothetical protein n=1 Tax=Asticcacaulis sp. TaxID=1872648 RepID=UPI003F7B8406